MRLKGVILSFVGEKWKNLSFLRRTRTLVPLPKVGTGTHFLLGNWYRYQKLGYWYPLVIRDWYRYQSSGTATGASSNPIFVPFCIVKSRISYINSIGTQIND